MAAWVELGYLETRCFATLLQAFIRKRARSGDAAKVEFGYLETQCFATLLKTFFLPDLTARLWPFERVLGQIRPGTISELILVQSEKRSQTSIFDHFIFYL